VAVDAKAPLEHFFKAADAENEQERQEHLREHAKDVLSYADDLAKRDYSAYPNVLPGTVMYLPRESMLLGALSAMPNLYDRVLAKGVQIVTPMLFVPLLQAYIAGYRQEQQRENVAAIGDAARELHRRLGIFVDHFATVGKYLSQAVDSYNKAVASYQRRLLPQAQRVDSLGAGDPGQRANVEALGTRDVIVHLPAVTTANGEISEQHDQDKPAAMALPQFQELADTRVQSV
jgi:DNA recombination protein RmuC